MPRDSVIELSVQYGLKRGDIIRMARETVPAVYATAQIVELGEKFAIAEPASLRRGTDGRRLRVRVRLLTVAEE